MLVLPLDYAMNYDDQPAAVSHSVVVIESWPGYDYVGGWGCETGILNHGSLLDHIPVS